MKKENHQSIALLKRFILFAFLFFTLPVYAQTESVKDGQEKHLSLQRELKGVFQIQMVGVRTKPAISTDLFERVRAEQLQSSQVIFMYGDNMRIVVLSKDEVTSGNLFSDDDLILYTTH
jgi:hypothetical protein